MTTIGLLTCQRLPGLYESDQTLIPFFAAHNIIAKPVIWNDPGVHWRDYDLLVIRNTWDYYTQPNAFSAWLSRIQQSGVPLLNPVSVVRDNMHKFYLKRFEEQGVTIIPTIFSTESSPASYARVRHQQWDKIVIKPAISAGSYLTKTYSASAMSEADFDDAVKGGDWLIQPFISEIATEGELSMIFFNGVFSHAVVKVPQSGDFRVQRQYGGHYKLVTPDAALLETGQRILEQVPQRLLYARVDGVMIQGKFHLMELELIEPDLYFEFGSAIANRFVESVITYR